MSSKRYLYFILALCFLISNVFTARAFAGDISTTISGYIKPTLIKVSAPARIIFSVDPNADKEKRFKSSEVTIENNSNAPVKVSVNAGPNNFTQSNDSRWKPEDVLPDELNWSYIGTAESESYLALGIMATGEGWRKSIRDSPLYVMEQNQSKSSIEFGEIDSNSKAQMVLVCSYGLSFKSEKECTYTVVWSFSLGD